MMKRVTSAIVLVAAVVAMGLSGCGGGTSSTQQALVGGRSVATERGQRVRVFKLLEDAAADATRGKFIGLSGRVCNARREGFTPASRFMLEVDHKRLVNPDPQLQFGAAPADLSATSGAVKPGQCIEGWDAYGLNANARVTAVVFAPDTRHPRSNQVRFRLPDRRIPPPTQFPSEEPSATSATTTPARIEGAMGQSLTTALGNRVIVHAYDQPVPATPPFQLPSPGQDFAAIDVELCQDQPPAPGSSPGSSAFELVLPDNTRATPAGTARKPELPLIATLGQGDCIRGWVGFQVPTGIRPKDVLFRTEPPLHWRL